MKKLLLLFSISVALSAKAQTSVYHPFPDSDAVWNVLLASAASCNATGYYTEYYSIIISGDTLINSTSYHKLLIPYVHYYNSDTSGQCYISPYTGKGNIGFIRQDTLLKRVFFRDNGGSTDHLLYDFNLHVGDSASYYCFGGSTYTIHVQKEDSIFIGNDYRKKWFITSTGGSASGGLDSIIEGIGSLSGLINYWHPFNPQIIYLNSFLECFQYNGNIIYPASSIACNIDLSADNIRQKNISITLSPNPFHTTATLEINPEKSGEELKIKNAELKIYDVMGRLVQIVSPLPWRGAGGEAVINRNGLPDGLYFYQLSNNDGLQLTGKFVIE